MMVCGNTAEHLRGSLYVRFERAEEAGRCCRGVQGRLFMGRELHPRGVFGRGFGRMLCRQEGAGECERAGSCNYVHMMPLSVTLKKALFLEMFQEHPEYRARFEQGRRRFERQEG
jgi:splicing factor U2AF subunit